MRQWAGMDTLVPYGPTAGGRVVVFVDIFVIAVIFAFIFVVSNMMSNSVGRYSLGFGSEWVCLKGGGKGHDYGIGASGMHWVR